MLYRVSGSKVPVPSRDCDKAADAPSAAKLDLARRTVLRLLAGASLALFVVPAVPADAGAAPRYYIRLRAVEMAEGVSVAASPGEEGTRPSSDSVLAMARENLLDALSKRPEVVLQLDGVAADAPPESYAQELKRRKLKGYEVTLRITKLDRAVKPPPAGRKFRLLEQSMKLSLVGTLYPGEPTLALGGDGESTVQIEVGKQISENQERDVLTDVLKDAIGQAVSQALRKLEIGPMKPPKDVRRRPKK